jgi:hypothetical protein
MGGYYTSLQEKRGKAVVNNDVLKLSNTSFTIVV